MDKLHPRADWESVGDRWFRKTQQYTAVFDQDLDLDNYIVAGAPYAGALGELYLLVFDSTYASGSSQTRDLPTSEASFIMSSNS